MHPRALHPTCLTTHRPLTLLPTPPTDAIELDYALVEDQGWGFGGVGMTPGRTPGRSPSYNLRMSPSQMASPAVRGGAGLLGVVQWTAGVGG